jgi:ubiquitin-like-conjugating enzyme ATG3
VAHASIHPCKHSATLKKIIDQMESGDGPEMRSDMSLLLFLKFLSSIIPTIEYDFTVNFDTGGVAKHR